MNNDEYTAIINIKPGLKDIKVIFIVLEIGTTFVTKQNREIRNFKVADCTACINVGIWDDPGKLIMPGDIIKLKKGYASVWRQCLTLYSGKNGQVFKVDEFCMTFNEAVDMSEPKRFNQQHVGAEPGPVAQGGVVMSPTQITSGAFAVGSAQVVTNPVAGLQQVGFMRNGAGETTNPIGDTVPGIGVALSQPRSKPNQRGRRKKTRARNMKAQRK